VWDGKDLVGYKAGFRVHVGCRELGSVPTYFYLFFSLSSKQMYPVKPSVKPGAAQSVPNCSYEFERTPKLMAGQTEEINLEAGM
jgi:hypothetical protein